MGDGSKFHLYRRGQGISLNQAILLLDLHADNCRESGLELGRGGVRRWSFDGCGRGRFLSSLLL
jgi:hypothetical protein